ncbi:hypothetical protein WS45_01510 [Burkholderia sp. RF2-non_BP3]|nr:hypothetical protein WS45_01510 [Burkholderia sp. RF2-non_BP3]
MRLGATGPFPPPRSARRASLCDVDARTRARVRVGATVRCSPLRRSSVDAASFVCRTFEAAFTCPLLCR